MTNEETNFVPVESDYTLPDGATWTEPPCPGSVGSPPNLDDIQAQLNENKAAAAEHRAARALAIHCGFCMGFHIEMQPPVISLIGGESSGSDNTGDPVSPPPNDPPPVETIDPSSLIETVGDMNDSSSGSSTTTTDSGSPTG